MEEIRPDNVNAQRPDNVDAQRPDNGNVDLSADAQSPAPSAQSPAPSAPALRAAYRQAGGSLFGLLGERPYHVEVMTDDSVWGVFEDGSRELADPEQTSRFLEFAPAYLAAGMWETFDPSPVNVNEPQPDPVPGSSLKPGFYRLHDCLYGGLLSDKPAYLHFDGRLVDRLDAVTGLSEGEPWEGADGLAKLVAAGSVVQFDPDNAEDWVPLIGRDEDGLYVLATMRQRLHLPDAMIERLPALKEAVSRLTQEA
jgi:hypothetical protein